MLLCLKLEDGWCYFLFSGAKLMSFHRIFKSICNYSMNHALYPIKFNRECIVVFYLKKCIYIMQIHWCPTILGRNNKYYWYITS